MWWNSRRQGRGFAAIEILAVTAVMVLLLAMGFMLYRGMRLAARVSVAEGNLKSVSTAMELYFREHNRFPPQGSDLTVELAPFIGDPKVFHNPLLEEAAVGQTINQLYHEPSLARLDGFDNYITAMIADNGRTMVVLRSGHLVVRRDDIAFDPAFPDQVANILDPDYPEFDSVPPDEGGFDVDEDGDVTTKKCSDVTIDCIGSEFGYADGTLVDIAAEAKLDADWMDLYGGQPVSGGESFSQASVPAGTNVIVKGEIAGSYERWLWSYYGYPLSYTSNDTTGQVLTLVSGDTPVCFEPGFPCQSAVGDLLESYVDPQTYCVAIDDTEALYLWDFNPLHTEYGIDFQDLIILATAVATDAAECEE